MGELNSFVGTALRAATYPSQQNIPIIAGFVGTALRAATYPDDMHSIAAIGFVGTALRAATYQPSHFVSGA